MDVKLLENVGRNVILTGAGTYCAQAAWKMMDIYDAMSRDLFHSDNMIRGSLRFGISFPRNPVMLPEVLARFHREYPNVEVVLFEENSYQLESQIANGIIDLIAAKEPVNSYYRFGSRPLVTEEFLLALREGHPASDHAVLLEDAPYPWLDLWELSGECFLLLKPGHHTRYMADCLFKETRFSPARTMMTANVETAIGIAAVGLGAAFLPSFFTLKKNCVYLNLQYFSVGPHPEQRTYTDFRIMFWQEMPLTKYTERFIQIMQEYCREFYAAPEK